MAPLKHSQRRQRSGGTVTNSRSRRYATVQTHSSTGLDSQTTLGSSTATSSTPGVRDRRRESRTQLTHSDRPDPRTQARSEVVNEQSIASIRDRPDDGLLDDEVLNEVVMAVNVTDRGIVGCAYYVASSEKLLLMEDMPLGGPDVVDALKLFIDPTVVLVPTKCSDEVFNRLDPQMGNPRTSVDGREGDQTRLPYLLEARPNSEFAYELSRNKLSNLRIGEVDGPDVTFVVPGDVLAHDGDSAQRGSASASRQEHLLRLAGWINVESRFSVGCAGAVLSSLQRKRTTAFLPGDEASTAMFRVSTLEMFSLKGSMFVNADTLLSLQITSTESHPNAQNQGPASRSWSSSGSKEGLSVYGLFHPLAKTTQGRHILRQYFLRPSLALEIIDERLETVSVLLRPDNCTLLDQIVESLAKVKNMHIATQSLRKGISTGQSRNQRVSSSIWPTIRNFSFYALRIVDHVREVVGGDRLPIRSSILEKFDTRQLAVVGSLISEIVDFEISREQNRTVVRAGVDRQLDALKDTYDGIENLLYQVTEHIAGQVPADLDAQINVIYFPQIGFLIASRVEGDTGCGAYEGPAYEPWERMFVTGAAVYFKNKDMTALDQEFGDIYSQICDREIEIVQELGERVLEYEQLLNAVSDTCGTLDSLVALARGARQYNLVRPRMTEQNVIKIKGGRHPLQELTVPSYVANDTLIVGGAGSEPRTPPLSVLTSQQGKHSEGSRHVALRKAPNGPSMVLMTGPNYSGKSVYLKQVAIIVYLAHIGSFVPAEAAKIGLTDKILTRISTRESVSRIQSAFMIDLQQISMALSLVTRRSLIVVDEFGKGTESCDGAGLAAGVYEHLLQRGVDCPKVLGATHFHEIFESGFLHPRPELSFAHMEVKIDPTASELDDQITYLYTCCPGRSNSSFGTQCAKVNGIEQPITDWADELIFLASRGEDLVAACAKLSQDELAELEDAETIARDFLAVEIGDCRPRELIENLITLISSTMDE